MDFLKLVVLDVIFGFICFMGGWVGHDYKADHDFKVHYCQSLQKSPMCVDDKGVLKGGTVTAFEDAHDGHMKPLFSCDCKTGKVK